jgi:hypothetical protein
VHKRNEPRRGGNRSPFRYAYFPKAAIKCPGRVKGTLRAAQTLGRSADEVTDDDDTYQSFECVVFTRVHLLNLKTVKVLGEEED